MLCIMLFKQTQNPVWDSLWMKQSLEKLLYAANRRWKTKTKNPSDQSLCGLIFSQKNLRQSTWGTTAWIVLCSSVKPSLLHCF